MAIKIDWDVAKEKGGSNFKSFAECGKYKTRVIAVEVHPIGKNGSIGEEFIFEESDYEKYPKATHWLSFKNDNWRYWHNKSLFEVLGASDAEARKLVEACEDGKDKDAIARNYQTAYTKAVLKQPVVEIEVYEDENGYLRSDFTNRQVRMGGSSKKNRKADEDAISEIMESGDSLGDSSVDSSEIPF